MRPRLVFKRLPEPPPHCPRAYRYGWFIVSGKFERGIQPQEAGVLVAMIFAKAAVKCADLIDALWGDDPEGGPLHAEKAVHVYVCRLNKTLRAFGREIKGQRGRDGGYRLIRLPERQAA